MLPLCSHINNKGKVKCFKLGNLDNLMTMIENSSGTL